MGREFVQPKEDPLTQRANENIEVAASLPDVFRYWPNFENFPNLMQKIEEILMTGENTSRRTIKNPLRKGVGFAGFYLDNLRTTRKE